MLISLAFLMSYPLGELAAAPKQCPKIDQAMLKADKEKLVMGGELNMEGFRWRVIGGNLCNPSCGNEYQQAQEKGVKIESRFAIEKPEGSVICYYDFKLANETVASLELKTDDSMKLPEHSFKRWSDVTNKVDKEMEKEEEQYRDDPRVRME
jgi:hypothetical protein